jgi:hypothetical protein
MPDSSLNSQIVYNFAGDPEPLKIKVGDEDRHAVAMEDFIQSMGTSEEALGQKILQDNNDKIRILKNVADQDLTTLDSGTATAAQCAIEINKLQAIVNSLVIAGKS